MWKINEPERIKTLEDYEVLYSLPEKEFDEITEMAALICQMPISLISLIHSEKQWFKSKIGINMPEVPTEFSFCVHTIKDPENVMVVEDPKTDDRFRDNHLINNVLKFQYYAGAALVSPNGQAIGTLCVLDKQKRELNENQLRSLKILANCVITQLELRKKNIIQKRFLDLMDKQLTAITDQTADVIITLDRDLAITFINRGDFDLRNYKTPENNILNIIDSDYHPDFRSEVNEVFENGKTSQLLVKANFPGQKEIWLQCRLAPLSDHEGKITEILVIASDITIQTRAEETEKQYARTLEEMVFMLSHKIRRPVLTCQGLIQLIDKSMINETDLKIIANYFRETVHELGKVTSEMTEFVNNNIKQN
jgi:PAS domain S-box-containing protein